MFSHPVQPAMCPPSNPQTITTPLGMEPHEPSTDQGAQACILFLGGGRAAVSPSGDPIGIHKLAPATQPHVARGPMGSWESSP